MHECVQLTSVVGRHVVASDLRVNVMLCYRRLRRHHEQQVHKHQQG